MNPIAWLQDHRKVKRMFKGITVKLEMPLCKCKLESLEWDFVRDHHYTITDLRIKCKTCAVQMLVPWKLLGNDFQFTIPYPDGKKP